jgi:hypothetical protein
MQRTVAHSLDDDLEDDIDEIKSDAYVLPKRRDDLQRAATLMAIWFGTGVLKSISNKSALDFTPKLVYTVLLSQVCIQE